jgi:energy-coupling factor transport system ATP-binding protein
VLIQLENAVYRYGAGTPMERTAVNGVSLEIAAGERVGIAGPTGSGKSTLVQLIAGLLKPASGQVLLDGLAAFGRSRASRLRRGRVGIAFQYPEHQVFEQTVSREVAFGLRNRGVCDGELEQRVQWALHVAGLRPDEIRPRSPFDLSGGELRRVALASVIAMRPEVLILDEPTVSLDPQGKRELLAKILGWKAESGATLVVVSHSLEDLARLADRIILLAHGQVAVDGTARQALSDAQKLAALGFGVPTPVAVMGALQSHGWPVRTDRLLPEEAAAEIAHALGRGGMAA